MTMRATTVIDYIVQLLVDEGITDCFGVPGDYAFPVCDAVERNPNVKWIGCSNKLPFGGELDRSLGRKSFKRNL
jgi:indolepyruvate decarboxylase